MSFPNTSDLSTVVLPPPLVKPSYFPLDMSGITGFVCGDDTISGMTAVHVYENWRWLGGHNSPGSFLVAQRLNAFANSASFRGTANHTHLSNPPSASVYADPMTLDASDTRKGPKFQGIHSGTVIEETGRLAALFMSACAALDLEEKVVPGQPTTQPITIIIADLGRGPVPEVHPARSSLLAPLWASAPILVSIATCVTCAVHREWCALLSILLGIIARGVSCLVLGSAELVFTRPQSANGTLPGDGILSSDDNIVLLKGTEDAVNSIIRGRFSLRFLSEDHFGLVRSCSVLFFIQCFGQLFLVPHASLFGHAMFFTSLGVSAVYNAWLSSSDMAKIHQTLLLERVLEHPTLAKYTFTTRATAAVFMLLILQPQYPTELLNELLPDDTRVWRQWKQTVLEQLRQRGDRSFIFEYRVRDLEGFTQEQRDLLQQFLDYARAAYDAYRDYLQLDSL